MCMRGSLMTRWIGLRIGRTRSLGNLFAGYLRTDRQILELPTGSD